jgi:hypothetical protein
MSLSLYKFTRFVVDGSQDQPYTFISRPDNELRTVRYVGISDRYWTRVSGDVFRVQSIPPTIHDLLKEEIIVISPILRAQLHFYIEKSVINYL